MSDPVERQAVEGHSESYQHIRSKVSLGEIIGLAHRLGYFALLPYSRTLAEVPSSGRIVSASYSKIKTIRSERKCQLFCAD
jgi:hypothetical protein